jgi:hypothetical protein
MLEEKYYSWRKSGAAGTTIIYAIKRSQLKEWFSNGPSHEPFETFEDWLNDFLKVRKAKEIKRNQFEKLKGLTF